MIMDYLRNLFLGPEEDREMEFATDEDRVDPKMFIPKLFCQVGDKRNGWHSKTVQNFATLLLTILSGGQGGKLSISDKSSPKPAWFRGSWLTYTNPATASIEANTDVIKGIFQHYNLDPKFHNLKPVHEEIEEGEVAGGAEMEEEVGEMRLEHQVLNEQGLGQQELNEQRNDHQELDQEQHHQQLENVPVVFQNDENVEENVNENVAMEVGEEIDDQEKTDTSLNLNLSSVSEPEIEDTNPQVVEKRRFNLFVKPRKENCVQAIQPRT